MSVPSFSDLFGISYVDSPSHWTFSTNEFDRVDLDNYAMETNAVICAIHEIMIRTYRGTLRDENADKLVDSIGGLIYNYAVHYDFVKLVPLGKSFINDSIEYNYLWFFADSDYDYDSVILDLNNDLVTFSGSTVMISKSVLSNPTTPTNFLFNLVAYIRQKNIVGMNVDSNSFITIKLNPNLVPPLDTDNIVS